MTRSSPLTPAGDLAAILAAVRPEVDISAVNFDYRLRGHRCPFCDQTASVYVSRLSATMLIGLRAMIADNPDREWIDVPRWKTERKVWSTNCCATLRHFGLTEPRGQVIAGLPDGDTKAKTDARGSTWWRQTPLAERFLAGGFFGANTLPKAAFIYDKTFLCHSVERATAAEILGEAA